MRSKEEHAHGPGQLLQLAQPRQDELPEFAGAAQSGARHAVMLDVVLAKDFALEIPKTFGAIS